MFEGQTTKQFYNKNISMANTASHNIVVHPRLAWILFYQETKNVNKVCEKFSISRKTFYKWWNRFQKSAANPNSLADQSKRPHNFPKATSITIISKIVEAKRKTGFGQRRLQKYLAENLHIYLSERTIWKLLKKYYADDKFSISDNPEKINSFQHRIQPGSVVQVGVKLLKEYLNGKNYVMYTAIDLFTHLRISKIYDCHIGMHASDFAKYIIEQFPFSIKEIQTLNDKIFTNGNSTNSIAASLYEPFKVVLLKAGINQIIINDKEYRNTILSKILIQDEVEYLSQKGWDSIESLKKELRNFLTLYNNHRQQDLIGHITPLQKLRSVDVFHTQSYFDPKE